MIRVGLALVLGVALTAGAYKAAESFDASVQQRVYEEQVERVGQLAVERLRALETPIETLGLYAERRDVNVNQYLPEMKARQSKSTQYQALAWLPVVKDRPLFEAEVNRYYPGFGVVEQNPQNSLQPAGPAAAWVPFLLLQPDHGNDVLRGMDIGNQPRLAETMQETYQRMAPALSPLHTFPGLDAPAMLMLRYVPVPEGFAGGLITPDAIVAHVLAGRPAGLVASLKDDLTATELLTESGFVAEGARRYSASVGGRTLTIDISAGPEYVAMDSGLSRSVLFAGAGVTVLMVGLGLLGGKEADA